MKFGRNREIWSTLISFVKFWFGLERFESRTMCKRALNLGVIFSKKTVLLGYTVFLDVIKVPGGYLLVPRGYGTQELVPGGYRTQGMYYV